MTGLLAYTLFVAAALAVEDPPAQAAGGARTSSQAPVRSDSGAHDDPSKLAPPEREPDPAKDQPTPTAPLDSDAQPTDPAQFATETAADTAPNTVELSLQAAVASVQRTHRNAKILSAETLEASRSNGKVYRIKFLTHDGRVRVVQVPAQRITSTR